MISRHKNNNLSRFIHFSFGKTGAFNILFTIPGLCDLLFTFELWIYGIDSKSM